MRELAEHLKSERIERGLTLRDVSAKARISTDMLVVLERGDYERIGASILVRGFIKAYCEALDLDPAPLLEQYASEISACDRQEESIRRFRDWSRAVNGRRRLGFLGLVILCASMVGALYGGIWVYDYKVRMAELTDSKMDVPQQDLPPDLPKEATSRVELGKMVMRGKGNQPTEATSPQAVPTAPGKPATSGAENRISPGAAQGTDSVTSTPTSTVAADAGKTQDSSAREPVAKTQKSPPEADPHELSNPAPVMADDTVSHHPLGGPEEPLSHSFQVEAHQKTWIQVKIDNDKTYSVMMQPGEKREWRTRDGGMHVVVGNAGGVRMRWDGDLFGSDGKPGQVLRFRLPDFHLAEKRKPQ